MKPIINLEFTNECSIELANEYFSNINKALGDNYILIGSFKPDVNIKEIFGENVLLNVEAKEYTVNEVLKALELYEKEKEENKCQT